MKASEYQELLKAALRRDAAVPGLAFSQCVELAALGIVFPEVRESRKWQLEWEYCVNRFKAPQGWDGRFLGEVQRETQWLRQCANGPEGVTAFWREFAWNRYRVVLPGLGNPENLESLESLESLDSGRPAAPRRDGDGAEREKTRFEGGLASGTGKDRPEGRGAICNGVATGLRGRPAPSDERQVTSDKWAVA